MVLALCPLLAMACTIGPSRRGALATYGVGPAGTTVPATTTSSVMPTGPGGPGQPANPIQWSRCPGTLGAPDTGQGPARFTIDCGGISVPMSYADRNKGTLTIRIARARSADLPADAPHLVTLLGDPGENGRSAIAAVAASLPAEITGHYSIVTVDLRGTGYSGAVDCLADGTVNALLGMAADPTTDKGAKQLDALSRQLIFDCGDLVGPSLAQFNSTNAADDLDTLRAALGVPTLSLLGRGYGATLIAVYANRYPGRVRAAVLDAPADPLAPADQRAANSAAAAESLFDSFAAACGQFSAGCPLGDHPRQYVADLVHRLTDSGFRASDGYTMTGGSVLLAMMLLLGRSDQWPELAVAIKALNGSDANPLDTLLTKALGASSIPERLAGRILFSCNDSALRLTAAQIAAAVQADSVSAPLFGPFAVAQAALCSSWPAPEATLGAVTAIGAAPIVVIGSVQDPISPYKGVQSLAGQLSSAVLLSWQSGRHGGYPTSSCVTSAVDAYLLHGTIPAMGSLCPP